MESAIHEEGSADKGHSNFSGAIPAPFSGSPPSAAVPPPPLPPVAAAPYPAFTARDVAFGKEADTLEINALQAEQVGGEQQCIQILEHAVRARVNWIRTIAEHSQRDPDNAFLIESYHNACERLHAAAEKLVVKCNTAGVAKFKAGDFEGGEELLNFALKFTTDGSFPSADMEVLRCKLRGITLNNFGCLERARGHFKEALGYMRQSMEVTKCESSVGYMNMSAILVQLRLVEDAKQMSLRAVNLLESGTEEGVDPVLLAVAYHNLAMTLELEDAPACLKAYERAYMVAKDTLGTDNVTTHSIERNWVRYQQRYRPFDVQQPAFSAAKCKSVHPKSLRDVLEPKQPPPAPSDDIAILFPHPFILSGRMGHGDGTLLGSGDRYKGPSAATAGGGFHGVFSGDLSPIKVVSGGRRGGGGGGAEEAGGEKGARGGIKLSSLVGKDGRLAARGGTTTTNTRASVLASARHAGEQQSKNQRTTSMHAGKGARGGGDRGKAGTGSTPRDNRRTTALHGGGGVHRSGTLAGSSKAPTAAPTPPAAAGRSGGRLGGAGGGSLPPSTARHSGVAAAGKGGRRLSPVRHPVGNGGGGSLSSSGTGGRGSMSVGSAQRKGQSVAAGTKSALPQVFPSAAGAAGEKLLSRGSHAGVQYGGLGRGKGGGTGSSGGRLPPLSSGGGESGGGESGGKVKSAGGGGGGTHGSGSGRNAGAGSSGSTGGFSSFSTSPAALRSGRFSPGGAGLFTESGAPDLAGGDLTLFLADRLDMLIHDEEEFERKYSKATMIQRAYRAHRSRQQIAKWREERWIEESLRPIKRNCAARIIQLAVYRHLHIPAHLGDRRGLKAALRAKSFPKGSEAFCATQIQRIARGWLGRRHYRLFKAYQRRCEQAVRRLQRWCRKVLADRRHAAHLQSQYWETKTQAERERCTWAATKVQSAWRGHLQWCRVAKELERRRLRRVLMEREERYLAARRIQCAWRCYAARKRAEERRVQKTARDELRQFYVTQQNASVKMQSYARMVLLRKSYFPELEKARERAARAVVLQQADYQAAVAIQKVYRGFAARNELRRRKDRLRRGFQKQREAFMTALLQRVSRGYGVRWRLGTELHRMNAEATMYQERLAALQRKDDAARRQKAILQAAEGKIAVLQEEEDDARQELELQELRWRRTYERERVEAVVNQREKEQNRRLRGYGTAPDSRHTLEGEEENEYEGEEGKSQHSSSEGGDGTRSPPPSRVSQAHRRSTATTSAGSPDASPADSEAEVEEEEAAEEGMQGPPYPPQAILVPQWDGVTRRATQDPSRMAAAIVPTHVSTLEALSMSMSPLTACHSPAISATMPSMADFSPNCHSPGGGAAAAAAAAASPLALRQSDLMTKELPTVSMLSEMGSVEQKEEEEEEEEENSRRRKRRCTPPPPQTVPSSPAPATTTTTSPEALLSPRCPLHITKEVTTEMLTAAKQAKRRWSGGAGDDGVTEEEKKGVVHAPITAKYAQTVLDIAPRPECAIDPDVPPPKSFLRHDPRPRATQGTRKSRKGNPTTPVGERDAAPPLSPPTAEEVPADSTSTHQEKKNDAEEEEEEEACAAIFSQARGERDQKILQHHRFMEERQTFCERRHQFRLQCISEATTEDALKPYSTTEGPSAAKRKREAAEQRRQKGKNGVDQEEEDGDSIAQFLGKMKAERVAARQVAAITLTRLARGFLDRQYVKRIRVLDAEYRRLMEEQDQTSISGPRLDTSKLQRIGALYPRMASHSILSSCPEAISSDHPTPISSSSSLVVVKEKKTTVGDPHGAIDHSPGQEGRVAAKEKGTRPPSPTCQEGTSLASTGTREGTALPPPPSSQRHPSAPFSSAHEAMESLRPTSRTEEEAERGGGKNPAATTTSRPPPHESDAAMTTTTEEEEGGGDLTEEAVQEEEEALRGVLHLIQELRVHLALSSSETPPTPPHASPLSSVPSTRVAGKEETTTITTVVVPPVVQWEDLLWKERECLLRLQQVLEQRSIRMEHALPLPLSASSASAPWRMALEAEREVLLRLDWLHRTLGIEGRRRSPHEDAPPPPPHPIAREDAEDEEEDEEEEEKRRRVRLCSGARLAGAGWSPLKEIERTRERQRISRLRSLEEELRRSIPGSSTPHHPPPAARRSLASEKKERETNSEENENDDEEEDSLSASGFTTHFPSRDYLYRERQSIIFFTQIREQLVFQSARSDRLLREWALALSSCWTALSPPPSSSSSSSSSSTSGRSATSEKPPTPTIPTPRSKGISVEALYVAMTATVPPSLVGKACAIPSAAISSSSSSSSSLRTGESVAGPPPHTTPQRADELERAMVAIVLALHVRLEMIEEQLLHLTAVHSPYALENAAKGEKRGEEKGTGSTALHAIATAAADPFGKTSVPLPPLPKTTTTTTTLHVSSSSSSSPRPLTPDHAADIITCFMRVAVAKQWVNMAKDIMQSYNDARVGLEKPDEAFEENDDHDGEGRSAERRRTTPLPTITAASYSAIASCDARRRVGSGGSRSGGAAIPAAVAAAFEAEKKKESTTVPVVEDKKEEKTREAGIGAAAAHRGTTEEEKKKTPPPSQEGRRRRNSGGGSDRDDAQGTSAVPPPPHGATTTMGEGEMDRTPSDTSLNFGVVPSTSDSLRTAASVEDEVLGSLASRSRASRCSQAGKKESCVRHFSMEEKKGGSEGSVGGLKEPFLSSAFTTTTSSSRRKKNTKNGNRMSEEEASSVLYHFYHMIVAKKVTTFAVAILNEYNDARVEEEKSAVRDTPERTKSTSVTIQTPQEEERRGRGGGRRRFHKKEADHDDGDEEEEEDNATMGRGGIAFKVVDSMVHTGGITRGVAQRRQGAPKKEGRKKIAQDTLTVGAKRWTPSPPSSSSSASSHRGVAAASKRNGNETGEGVADHAARLIVHFFRMVVAKRTVHRLWNVHQDAVDVRVAIEKEEEEVEEKKKDPVASTRPPSSNASTTSSNATPPLPPPSRVLSNEELTAGRKICALFQQFIARRRLAMLQVAHLARLAVQVREDNQSILPPTPLGDAFSKDVVHHLRNRIGEVEKKERDDQNENDSDDCPQSSWRPGTEAFHRNARPSSTTPTVTGVHPSFHTPPPTPGEDSVSRRGTSGDAASRGSQGDDKWEDRRPPTTSGDSDNLVAHRNDPGRATATPSSFDTDSRLDSRDKNM